MGPAPKDRGGDTVSASPDGPTFSDAEYQRRWKAVADELPEYGIDAIAVTGPLFVPYLAGYDDDGMWPSPVIIGPDAKPTFVSREFDELTMRVESRIPEQNLVFFFGDDDHIQVWADTLRSLGLDKGRLGIDLTTYGITPPDVAELQRLLPEIQIVDATKLMSYVTAVKSDEELAVMRYTMELTKIGLEAFYEALHEGAVSTEVREAVREAMMAAGSGDTWFTLLVGERTQYPHAATGHSVMQPGDTAFIEHSGEWLGYRAGLCRSALLGRNQDIEDVHKLAEEAQQNALDTVKPGVVTGELDRAYRDTIRRSPLGIVSHARCGYVIGLGWQGRGHISIHPGGTDVIEEGMTLHMPSILFRPGKFCIGVSETIVVTKDGYESLSGLSRELVRV
jgi:Xaa-Pro aminopeptidase